MKKRILAAVLTTSVIVTGIPTAAFAAEGNIPAETCTRAISVSDIQSAHSYSNNMDETWRVSSEGASSITIKFSSQTKTESGYDYIYVLDKNGNQIKKESGTTLAGKTIQVSGDVVDIRLTSDSSQAYYGFSLDEATAEYSTHDYATEVQQSAGCETTGQVNYICSYCGDTYSEETSPLGHSVLSMSESEISAAVGASKQLSVTASPQNCPEELTWSSSNEAVATVSSTGLVSMVGAGSAIITATNSHGISTTCSVTAAAIEPEAIFLDIETKTVYAGDSFTIQTAMNPSNAYSAISWSSSSPFVVCVDESGNVSALKGGTAVITARTANGLSASATITVKDVVSGISLNQTSVSIVKGKAATLTSTISPATAETKVTWKSSNTAVASVNGGVVTAVGVGTATITAETENGKTATCTVTVTNPVTKIALNRTTATIYAGKTVALSATYTPTDAQNRSVTWNSSNTAVATVSASGVVTGKAPGTAKITATSKNGKTASCTVTVKLQAPVISSATSANSTVVVKWAKVPGATKYVLYRSTSKTSGYKAVATTTALSANVTGHTYGATYYYIVAAYNGTARSANSAAKACKAALTAPTMGTTATASTSAVKFSWSKNAAANGYMIYRKKSSESSYKLIKTITSNATLSYTDKISGAANYYVIAYKTVSGKKIYSAKSAVLATRTMKATTSINTSQYQDQFVCHVTWPAVSGANGYQVDYKVGTSGTWKKAKVVTSAAANVSQTHGGHYYYRVRPIYTVGGRSTYGAYYTSSSWYCIGYNPKYTAWVSSSTDSRCSLVGVRVTNNGVATMRVYSANARLSDHDYYSYDRNLKLMNDSLSYVTYTDIKPGGSAWLWFDVVGTNTWYDKKSRVYFDFLYDGLTYRGSVSSYYGTHYYQK